MQNRKLRIGVVGLRRGLTLALQSEAAGMEVVALCDLDADHLQGAGDRFRGAVYRDYDTVLAHAMDGVIVANYFDEHAPFALKALAAGKHVMSETAACRTIAEGVQLIRAVERTGLIYLFVENYPFKAHVREMQRRFERGEVGEFQYGECEYLHGWSPTTLRRFAPDPTHWRRRISSTAYCTHSVAPIMYITDTLPTDVSAFVVPFEDSPSSRDSAGRGFGTAAVMMIRMDNGALMKSLHGFLQGEQAPDASWVRIHGSRGLMENLRHGDSHLVRLRQEAWAAASGGVEDSVYRPLAEQREGTMLRTEQLEDYLVCESFATAIRTGEPPYFDVHRGVAASIVGICGLRSVLGGSVSVEIPDLRTEAVRRRYESDDWTGPVAAAAMHSQRTG